MEWLKISILAAGSYVALFIITKLIGYRQIAHLSIFDYVNSITIGSIAAEMATDLETPLHSLLAMGIFGGLVIITSLLSSHSLRLRRWLSGRTLVLLQNGTLYRENLKRAKMDVSEFLSQCRDQGYFDLSAVEMALLETSGKISILPKSPQRPATPADLSLAVPAAEAPINVVIDGELLADNLRHLGFEEIWLTRRLAEQDQKIQDTLLVTCDRQGTLTVFPKEYKPMTRDLYL